MDHGDKQAAYAADITYGTNNEFGFDYLRDNMVLSKRASACQRGLNYAIVDEVDSILIDEARTPLIISGQADDNAELYVKVNRIVPQLTRQAKETQPGERRRRATTTSTRKQHQVHLSEEGTSTPSSCCAQTGLIGEDDEPLRPAATSRSCTT